MAQTYNLWSSYMFQELNSILDDKTDRQKQVNTFTVRELIHQLLNMNLDATIDVDDAEVIGVSELKLTNKVKLLTRYKYYKTTISDEDPLTDFNELSNNFHQNLQNMLLQTHIDKKSSITDVNRVKEDWDDLLEK